MVYSLTAQRDNAHSLNLARLSHSQNNINLHISKFAAYESRLSNRMAKESLKYGVDMQVIAAVTLGFLPGTFVATLFSTSFWNFQSDNEGRVVTWRIVSRMRTDGLELPPVLDLGTLPGTDDNGDIEEKNHV
ncbi:hypothetical protein FOMG_17524 [Fusarium oxysporum f. sp. melonis 26406]|uniref:Uncharacterized protein n=1 Tax=Fusarium oxysporum f. sp. melonis 26406 TaxID=1089452 RepID=W9ZB76_FUSOX|nr:hypothetical protein FOMG_17524 [Fusarium oxysporum f. sp. melonis 26406]